MKDWGLIMYKIIFLLILVALSATSKSTNTSHPYIDAGNIEMHQNNVDIKLNDDGSIRSLVSTINVELVSTDDKSIKKALIIANILTKINLSKYISQDVSGTKSLGTVFNQNEYAQNYLISIEKSSNYLLKGASIINETIDKENRYVSTTIEVSDHNMKFANEAKSILGAKKTSPSKRFESYIKSLKIIDGVRIIGFNKKNYIVSFATKKINKPTLSSKLDALDVAYYKTRVNLSKFIFGEKISYNSMRTIEDIKTIKYNQSEEINEIIETFIEENSGIYSGKKKSVGFNTLKYINNDKVFYYLYLEIPKKLINI
jgi:hypothetical protein